MASLPERDVLVAEVVPDEDALLLRTEVAGRVTLVTSLPVEAEDALRATVPDAVLLTVVPEAVLLTVVPDAFLLAVVSGAVLLTVVPDAFLLAVVPGAVLLTFAPDAAEDLLTADVRTAPGTPAPETDEWELEASPPPMPLEP